MTIFEIISATALMAQAFILGATSLFVIIQLRIMKRDSENSIVISARGRAMDLIGRYGDARFASLRLDLVYGKPGNLDRRHKYFSVLNHFEEVALAVKHGVAEEIILKDFYHTVLKWWFAHPGFRKAFEKERKQDKHVFENLNDIWLSWNEADESKPKVSPVPRLQS